MKKISEDHKEIESGKKLDDEGYMAQVEMDKIVQSLGKLKKVIKSSDQQIPAWVQSKITKASDYLDIAADYLSSDVKMNENKNISYEINPKAHVQQGIKHRRTSKIEKAPTSSQQELPNINMLGPRLPKFEEVSLVDKILSELKEKKDSDPCWTGYKMEGFKKKKNKKVPNCVPVSESENKLTIVDKILSEMVGDKPGIDIKKPKSLESIAKKHKLSIESLEKQLEKGIKIEMEHTTDRGEAKTIALHHLEEIPDYYDRLNKMEKTAEVKEDLRDWLGRGGEGGVGGGGWDRYNTKGERVGKCGDAKEGDPYSACLSKEKAEKLGKDGIASFVKRKRSAQDAAGYDEKGEGPKGRKPVFVKTKVDENINILSEKNEPTNPKLWSRAKSLARQKFDVYPSAYANSWAAKWYKEKGGSWKSIDEAVRLPMQTGQLLRVLVNWRGKHLSVQMFFPQLGTPRRDEITYAVNKIYPEARVISYVPCEMDSNTPIVQVKEENELLEFKKSEMPCNKPKAQPVGNSLTGKSHVVKACEGGKEKLIRFGQKGVKGSPKKEGESEEYKNRRLRFKKRHRKNIKKGKMSAAYWSSKVKW